MKNIDVNDKDKAEIVRQARVAGENLADTPFWQQLRARLDQLDAAKRPAVEKRPVEG